MANEALATASLAQIDALAKAEGIRPAEAMIRLLRQDIWPLRFLRNAGALTAGEMRRLLSLRVFVAGCGGLGGHFASLLARLGVGMLRLCDPDVFSETNLNRQLFCTEKTLGCSKVLTVRSGLLDIASHLEVEALPLAVNEDNARDLLDGMDAAVDCLDSIAAKKMLEKAAAGLGIPFLHGSVLGHEGFVYLDIPGKNRLEILYPGRDDNQTPHTLATSVCGVATLMCSLFLSCFTAGGSADSGLLHLDCSIPELEYFQM